MSVLVTDGSTASQVELLFRRSNLNTPHVYLQFAMMT